MNNNEIASPICLGDVALHALEGRKVWVWDCGEFARIALTPDGSVEGTLERDSFGGWVARKADGNVACGMRILGGARISQQGNLLANKARY